MKNYKVIATRYFRDSSEIDKKTGLKIERQVNDEFYCTKERYEFLKTNNAVKLVEVQEDIETAIKEITEEEVQGISELVEEATASVASIGVSAEEILEQIKSTTKKVTSKKKKSNKK